MINFGPSERISLLAGFNGQGQVVFLANNTGPSEVIIAQASFHASGSNLVVYATQLSGTIIPTRNFTYLTATFQGVYFSGNTIYDFTLTSSRGSKWTTSALYYNTYTRTEQITVTQTALVVGSGAGAGQATFSLSNSGTSDVTLTTFLAQGGAISGTQSGTIVASGTTCTGGLVPKGSSCTLIISFSPATFTSGTRYDFTLVSSAGNKFPTSAIA